VIDLIGALERLVNLPHHVGNTVRRIQALVRIHLAREICIRRHLPTAQVNRLQSGLHLLHCLAAGHRSKRRNVRVAVQEFPETLCSSLGERVLDLERAAKFENCFRGVAAFDSVPAIVGGPGVFE
jgi:hypothetical protein